MKKAFFSFSFLFIFAPLVFSQSLVIHLANGDSLSFNIADIDYINFLMEPAEDTPILFVSPATLDFGTEETVKTIDIRNIGAGTLNWSVGSYPDWVSVSPPSGSTTDETDNVVVTLDRSLLAPGVNTGSIDFTSIKGGNKTVQVQARMPEGPILSVTPTSLDFGTQETEKTIEITNAGTGSFSWSISNKPAWISVSPSVGVTATETDVVTVTVNRASLSTGINTGVIEITSPTAGTKTVDVQAEQLAGNTVTGRWRQSFDLSGTTFVGFYNLEQNGTQLTGDFVFEDGSGYTTLHSSSKIIGRSITIVWYLDTYKLSFIGPVAEDFNSMRGDMYANDIKVSTWTAQRVYGSSTSLIASSNTNPLVETFRNILNGEE